MNRIVEWGQDEIRYEADQRHAEIIIKQLGMSGESKTAVTPGIKESEQEGDDEELSQEEATKYRALTARANFLAPDRSDIGYATKELTRK